MKPLQLEQVVSFTCPSVNGYSSRLYLFRA